MEMKQEKQAIAIGIAMQTHLLKTCPVHQQLYFDDDVHPGAAFALAIELIRKHKPYVAVFEDDEHQLTDLLSETLRTSPDGCPECRSSMRLNPVSDRSGLGESAFEGR